MSVRSRSDTDVAPQQPALLQIVVVTSKADAAALSPGAAGEVVTANEFLTGGARWGRPRATVVNLCRSLRYLSKGYYVSLLASARDQRVLPGVETLRQLGERHTLVRQLEEADVPTWEGPAEGERARRVAPGEQVSVLACFGTATDARFRRACAAIYRCFPVPLLRVTLRLQEKEWRVFDVEVTPLHQLAPAERAHLAQELADLRGVGPLSRRKAQDKRASIAILYEEQDIFGPSTTETLEKLERIAAKKGVHMHRLDLGDISRLGDYDALFIRALTGLNLPAFRWASRAEALDMPVIDDTQSIIRCSNKVFLHELLERKGVPTPRTLVASGMTSFESLVKALGLPFIVKLPDGSFSTAVHKVGSKADWAAKARPMLEKSPLIVAQAWTPTEFDWRVTTLGGKPLFTAKYHMAPGHWQVRNADPRAVRYGKVEAVARAYAPRDVVRLGCQAARLIGDGLYGVDIKDTAQGPLVIEVNDNPNIDSGFEDSILREELYRRIMEVFLERIESRKAGLARA